MPNGVSGSSGCCRDRPRPDLAENHSDLAVLDARNVSAGPVALFHMPVRVRMAFHGTWVPAETFRTRSYAMEIAR